MKHQKVGIFTWILNVSVLLFINCTNTGDITIPHTMETFSFQSGDFEIAGELRIPQGKAHHPLVIMVHGDGPAYRSYFNRIKNSFLKAGYATMIWDKPGSGASKGKFRKNHLQEDRSTILIAAIEYIDKHPRIQPNQIGVWGISQAGYVIPRTLTKTDKIAFMMLTGVAGENGIEQTAYFVGQQIYFSGHSEAAAKEAERLAAKVMQAPTYAEYVESGKILLEKYPVVKDLDFMAGILPENRWTPKDPNGEAWFNPIRIIQQTTIPTLVVMGEKDRNCDPQQSVVAYQQALEQAGNKHFKVKLIPGADHDIILCKTGSEKERWRRNRAEWSNYAPEYLGLMEDWLDELLKSNN